MRKRRTGADMGREELIINYLMRTKKKKKTSRRGN